MIWLRNFINFGAQKFRKKLTQLSFSSCFKSINSKICISRMRERNGNKIISKNKIFENWRIKFSTIKLKKRLNKILDRILYNLNTRNKTTMTMKVMMMIIMMMIKMRMKRMMRMMMIKAMIIVKVKHQNLVITKSKSNSVV